MRNSWKILYKICWRQHWRTRKKIGLYCASLMLLSKHQHSKLERKSNLATQSISSLKIFLQKVVYTDESGINNKIGSYFVIPEKSKVIRKVSRSAHPLYSLYGGAARYTKFAQLRFRSKPKLGYLYIYRQLSGITSSQKPQEMLCVADYANNYAAYRWFKGHFDYQLL